MLLGKYVDPDRKYRLSLNTGWGPMFLDLSPLPASARKAIQERSRRALTPKGYLPNAVHFECDDESQMLTFWQEGKGVAVELCAHVPYTALLVFEPLD
jgi:hypothetical protein